MDLQTNVIDMRHVIAALHATGSSDPDVLFARKEELLARSRKLSARAAASILSGVAISLTVVGLIVGIRAIRKGLALHRCNAANCATIESTYTAFVARVAQERKNISMRTF